MTWEEYYEKFYDWSTATQIRQMYSLTSFGDASEVAEVAQEFMDEKAASRFLKRALAAGVRFAPEEIYELSACCDTDTMNELVKNSAGAFTQEQLEDLDGIVDEHVLRKTAKRDHVTLFCYEDDDFEVTEERPRKLGFFGALAFGWAFGGLLDRKKEQKRDCADGPAHYGYRYGRWYYGHHHTHGCELDEKGK